jgi:UDP-N-acetylmuramoyl-L-alanyl-D-glutamate--2,6-diaminopimelate ligase
MGRIASELADVVIVTSDNPRSEDPLAIIDQIVAGMGSEPEVEPDRARAIGRAIELAGIDDVVVIAGKGHERGQETAGVITPFDDAEVAGELLRALKTTA